VPLCKFGLRPLSLVTGTADAEVTKTILDVPNRSVIRRNRQLDPIPDTKRGRGAILPDSEWSLAIVVNTDIEGAVSDTDPSWIFFNSYVDTMYDNLLSGGSGKPRTDSSSGDASTEDGAEGGVAKGEPAGGGRAGAEAKPRKSWFCCFGGGVSAEELK